MIPNPLESFIKERDYLQEKKSKLDVKIIRRQRANELLVSFKREFPIEFFDLYRLDAKSVLYSFGYENKSRYLLFVIHRNDEFDIVELNRDLFEKRVLYTVNSLKDAFNQLLNHVRDDISYDIHEVIVK